MTSPFPSFLGQWSELVMIKMYTEAPLSAWGSHFTWSTASGFTFEVISPGNSSTTTISFIIIMGVNIYVPLFQRTFFSIITCKHHHNVDPPLFLPPKSLDMPFLAPYHDAN